MSLEKLPNEILVMIAHECEGHSHRMRDILSLSFCSHKLNAAAESTLYSSVKMYSTKGLLQLLRSIMTRPKLAQYVTRFEATDDENDMENDLLFRGNLNHKASSILHQAISSIDTEDLSGNKNWFQDLYTGRRWDCAVAAILILLPRVDQLSLLMNEHPASIEDPFQGNYKYINKVLRHASAQRESQHPIRILEHLETVVMNPADFKMAHVTTLCRFAPRIVIKDRIWLPSLTKPLEFPSLSVQLRIESVWNIDSFKKFVGLFPSLEEFVYQPGPGYSRNIPQYYSMNALVRSLVKTKTSLKRLSILPARYSYYNSISDSSVETLASFEHMVFLEVVAFDLWVHCEELSIEDLASAFENSGDGPILHPSVTPLTDLLPKSIEHLTLREATNNTLLHVQGLLETKCRNVPKLRFIRIVLDPTADFDDVLMDVAFLEELALECGVTLVAEN
ncbi:hypothetical protein BDZ45DRAFT_796376 [Acephala macrosclerotiorum]|nr:hypothetical protein BDZ45DRAFT_796376 [Acephala macrosclerotiorum]